MRKMEAEPNTLAETLKPESAATEALKLLTDILTQKIKAETNQANKEDDGAWLQINRDTYLEFRLSEDYVTLRTAQAADFTANDLLTWFDSVARHTDIGDDQVWRQECEWLAETLAGLMKVERGKISFNSRSALKILRVLEKHYLLKKNIARAGTPEFARYLTIFNRCHNDQQILKSLDRL